MRLVRHWSYVFRTNQVLGTAFHDVARGKLYPTISLKKPGDYIRANFGQTPFVYNIDDQMRVGLHDSPHSTMYR